MFIGLSLDFCRTFIERLSIFCQIFIQRPFEFRLTAILFRLTIIPFRPTTVRFHLMVISFHPTTILFRSMAVPFKDVHSLFILVDAPYSLNRTLCYNFVGSVLYCYKIQGNGTTPCPWMLRVIPLSQSLGINYEITHNPLSRFL
jgi:hypothetical protein